MMSRAERPVGCVASGPQRVPTGRRQPLFQFQHLVEDADLVALSANFALYGDMNDRFMNLTAGFGPEQEIYSIDETFIALDGTPNE